MLAEQSDLTQFLQRYARFGIDLGLERIVALLTRLGSPQARVSFVHVAGTNGKGSVCAYLASVLTAAGYRVGRYTSPHLVHWTERVTLDGTPVSPMVLLQALQRVEATIDPAQPTPTQFELLTAAAWLIFAEAAVDIAVIEVGLGGRLDATNVSEHPLVSVITSISRDHWQRLGSTLAEIAAEKAGILKPNRPAVIGPVPSEAEVVIRQRAQALNCPMVWPTPAQWLPDQLTPMPWATADGLSYPLPLAGDMQLTNSAVAITALRLLQQQGWVVSDTAIQEGMTQAQWQGRLQWTQWQGIKLLIDGAHNTAAAQVLRQYVDQIHSGPTHWLMGMIAPKDHGDILAVLLRPGDHLTLMPVPGHATADPQVLSSLAQSLCPHLVSCRTVANLNQGLHRLSDFAEPQPLHVLCGSLYLVGCFLELSALELRATDA
jgi:dihydrofolate synthase/folylpolyglutamate synthase